MSEHFEIEYNGKSCQGPFRVRPVLEAGPAGETSRAELLDARGQVVEVFRPQLEDEIRETAFESVRARAELCAAHLNERLESLRYKPSPITAPSTSAPARPRKESWPSWGEFYLVLGLYCGLAMALVVWTSDLHEAPASASTPPVAAEAQGPPVVVGIPSLDENSIRGWVEPEDAQEPFSVYPAHRLFLRVGEAIRPVILDARFRRVNDTELILRTDSREVISPSEETGQMTAKLPGEATLQVSVPDLRYEAPLFVVVQHD